MGVRVTESVSQAATATPPRLSPFKIKLTSDSGKKSVAVAVSLVLGPPHPPHQRTVVQYSTRRHSTALVSLKRD